MLNDADTMASWETSPQILGMYGFQKGSKKQERPIL